MLDTKHKRGSSISMGAPFRSWLSEPAGTLTVAARVSLLKLGTAAAPAPVVVIVVYRAASIRGPAYDGTL